MCTEQTDHVYFGDNVVLCKVLTKYKMYVNTNDRQIAPHLILDGFWESWITRFLAGIIKPGFTCLDIGANLGYYSLLMAELVGREGKTIAVEPNPQVAELLRAAQANHSWRFEVVEAAMADRAGEAILTIPDKSLGGATIKPNDLVPGRTQVKVRTLSVDELVEEYKLAKVDVIKMDVEGMEPVAFAGMRNTLASNPDIQIVFEYSPGIYNDAAGFTRSLFDQFNVYEIEDTQKIRQLNEGDIPQLTKLEGHTDWYLRKK
jgi:FkbM family methyltransferase